VLRKEKIKKVSEKITAFSSKFRTIRREYSNDADKPNENVDLT
jgi:hypothetical protein